MNTNAKKTLYKKGHYSIEDVTFDTEDQSKG